MKLKLKNLFRKDPEFKGWSYYFNRHPLMVMFYSLFSIAFGAIFLFTAINLFIFIAGKGSIIPFEIPITFKIVNKDLLVNSNYLITRLTAGTNILRPTLNILTLSFIIITLFEISTIYFLYHFQKIIFSAIDEKPFVMKNVYRLRYIGILLLLIPPVMSVLVDQVHLSLSSKTIIDGFQVASGRFKIDFIDPFFILGGFSLILSEVFKIGIRLREEQELTV